MFDTIIETIDNIFYEYPSVNIRIRGDFNIHHKEGLAHSNKTDKEGRYSRDVSIVYELT